jgi:hypothetical protein
MVVSETAAERNESINQAWSAMTATMHQPSPRTVLVVLAAVGMLLAGVPARCQEAPPAEKKERLTQLGGRAYLGRNAPVVGATVLVRPEGRPGEAYLTSTDEHGVFRVDGLPDGSYSVRVEREGLAARAKDDVPVKFPFRAVVELEMSPLEAASAEPAAATPAAMPAEEPLQLRGQVVEAGAGPVGEVRLRFVRPDGLEDPRILRSRPDGTFEIEGAGPGVWRVEASGVGYLSQRIALDLRGTSLLKVILVRQPADYHPTPLELMPPEQPIPPQGFVNDTADPGAAATEPDRDAGGGEPR